MIQAFYFTGSGQLPLTPDAQGTVIAAAGRTVLIQLPTSGLRSSPVSGTLQIKNSTYALTQLPGQPALAATFVPSFEEEEVEAVYTVQFEDGTSQSGRNMIDVRSGGRVVEDPVLRGISPVEGATVTLFEAETGRVWDGTAYGQANPIMSGQDGGYVFVVPNGDYIVRVSKEEYVTQERQFSVSDHIIAEEIVLPRAFPVPFIGPVIEGLQTEPAKQAANVAAIAATVAVAANVASAASLVSVVYYLWFLFTQPILLLGRKKRKKWGLVYNSLSKEPVDLAAVRLQDAKTNRVVQTRVTGRDGRFIFRAKPGRYTISVAKNGFDFPTEHLKDAKEDGKLIDIYHGELLEVKEDGAILAVNIPLDPATEAKPNKKVILLSMLRKLQHAVALLGPVITLFALILSPSLWMGGLFLFQVVTYLLFLRLAKPKKPKGWGVIYDKKSRKPLSRAVVRIFDRKFNKLLETQVTGANGVYGFFASDNVYFVTAEKQGFEKYKSEDMDLTKREKATVDQHIALERR